jgi:hypothetical protein
MRGYQLVDRRPSPVGVKVSRRVGRRNGFVMRYGSATILASQGHVQLPQSGPTSTSMRLLIAFFLLANGGTAFAENVPLPHPRPLLWVEPQSFREAAGPDFNSADVLDTPTDCDQRLQAIAAIEPMPRLIGPEACGGGDMVRLNAALRPDGTRIELKPAPVLRCSFAESLVGWLRDEVAPLAGKFGADLRSVQTYDDYECRGRNRVVGAKLSEHGKGNAVDLRSFTLSDGRALTLTDVTVAKDFRDALRDSACHRFTTVLGPGSDSHHEGHIHLDLADRHRGYRMCQWDVREPPVAEVAVRVPIPVPRPAIANTPARHTRKL